MSGHPVPAPEAKSGRGVGSGGIHFLGPACGSGLSFSFFNDQFLVLEKKKKAKEREFEIYRKQYQCFVFFVFHLPHIHILPVLGSLLQLLIQLLHLVLLQPEEQTVPDASSWWHRGELLNLSTRSAPFLSSPHHPSLSSSLPLTGSPRPPEEAASHKLASGQCPGRGALLWSSLCLGSREQRQEGSQVHSAGFRSAPALEPMLRRGTF
uniref:Uncharacterized protein n=1 Tax=Molossus molossus TaxID=27622 RepID=A0A7J8HBY5_MOLMO|nr:hypothetical protein HJG59_011155 [Molossus molossus]